MKRPRVLRVHETTKLHSIQTAEKGE